MMAVAHPLALGIGVGLFFGGLLAFVTAVGGPQAGLMLLGIFVFAFAFTAFVSWALCGSIFGAC